MKGVKSCYIAKTISQEIAWGTLLGQDSPKQLLKAQRKCGSSLSHGRISCAKVTVQEAEPFHVPGRLSTPMAFLKLFQFSSTIRSLGSSVTENQALRKPQPITNWCYKGKNLYSQELISQGVRGISVWRRFCYVETRIQEFIYINPWS